jgi:hypothetical protein
LDELVLQNFRSVLQKGQDDKALLSAVMLTFLFTVTAGMTSRQCLEYQNTALSSLRRRISSPDRAATESTIGTILLLAGIEVCAYSSPTLPYLEETKAKSFIIKARLGMPRQVQLHMGAIRHILEVCQRKGVYLSDDIKRAVFW